MKLRVEISVLLKTIDNTLKIIAYLFESMLQHSLFYSYFPVFLIQTSKLHLRKPQHVIAFTRNVKHFATAFIYIFFSSSFSSLLSTRTGISFSMRHYLLTRKHVTRIRLISLDTLGNVFISVFFIVKSRVCKHNMHVL